MTAWRMTGGRKTRLADARKFRVGIDMTASLEVKINAQEKKDQ